MWKATMYYSTDNALIWYRFYKSGIKNCFFKKRLNFAPSKKITDFTNKYKLETLLIKQAKSALLEQFNQQQPSHLLYHSYQHSIEVAETCALIAQNETLTPQERENLLIAAYFHDIGYLKGYQRHENSSKEFAQQWLNAKNLPPASIQQVLDCIEATRFGSNPQTLLEQIIADADISYGLKHYPLRSRLLRAEWESSKTIAKTYPKMEWLKLQTQFLSQIRFHTDYARQHFAPLASKHLLAESKKLAEGEKEQKKEKEKKQKKQKAAITPLSDQYSVYAQIEAGIPSKGIQSFFRAAYPNLISLSAIADNKANFMISINSIVLTLLVAIFSVGGLSFDYVSHSAYVLPVGLFVGTAILSLILAVLSVMPNNKYKGNQGLNRPQVENIIAYTEFAQLPMEAYEALIQQVLGSSELLYGNMSRDLYQLGCQLQYKYKLLRFAYLSFLFGFAFSSLLLIAVFFV